MTKFHLTLCTLLYLCTAFTQDKNWESEKILVCNESSVSHLISANQIFEKRWDVLPQPQFWKKIMCLTPDTCIVNIARNRHVLETIPSDKWIYLNKENKRKFRDSMRTKYALDDDELVYVTSGKNHFYKFEDVYPSISKGIEMFDSLCVDPWYAQSILLIESPGQLKKSVSGAYGPFQLMPRVARAQGLIVNKTKDERKDFNRSAYGAASLIKNICIPETKNILKRHQIKYHENDIWFRLLVLHVYHAGAYNVAAVIDKIQPKEGTQKLIMEMWQNKAAGFGNCSQNYSQIALAAHLILHDIVYENCSDIISPNSK
ncbi:MAG: hypothetical protein HOH34_01620 [Flavobacteriales bacterium]|jgi:hypothetical protein|nr:hypothetical protein [Flavobacteriales bacterium]